MSEENAHGYQTEVPVEMVDTTSSEQISNAFAEKNADVSETPSTNEETSQPEVEAEQSNNDEFASKFAALSRREKSLRDRENQIEQKIKEFEAKMESFQQPEVEEKPEVEELPLEYRLRKNPLKTLEEQGISYEDLTQMVLNDGKLSTEHQLRLMREEIEKDYKSKYDELQNKLLEKERKEEEQSYQQTINNFKTEIKSAIDQSEEFEFIQRQDAYELVYDVIEDFYNENGSILDTQEAARQVETYLEEEAKALFEKSNKIKSWIQPKETQATPRQPSPTLSNSTSATSTPVRADRLLSREESLAKLAAEFGDKLWKD